MAEEISVGSVIIESLALVFVRSLRTVFNSKSFVDDFHYQMNKLMAIREDVEPAVGEARKHGQVINKNIEEWLAEADALMLEVQNLDNELKENTCFFLGSRYRLTKQVRKITARMKELFNAAVFQDRGSFSSDGFLSRSAKSAFDNIMEALNDDHVKIIGLYGMGGIGKTTLATQVAKEVTRLKIFNHVVIVIVSQIPNVRMIQATIADVLGLTLHEVTGEGRAGRLYHRLRAEKILIILDDVWNQINLGNIGIPTNSSKGVKILLTSRRRDVCNSMNSEINISLNLLSEDESQLLFKENAGLSHEFDLSDTMKQIVEECKCLPLALVTVGRALKDKNEDAMIAALKALRRARPLNVVAGDNLESTLCRSIRLSYDYLNGVTQSHTQFVLLICSLFPEDYQIDVEDLTRCVFGLELFDSVKSIEDARRALQVSIRLLKDLWLLLDTENKNCLQLHDFVQDAVLRIGSTESREKCVFRVENEHDLKKLIEKKAFQNCRGVSFMNNSIAELCKYDFECPNLEIVLIFDGNEGRFPVELPDRIFKQMKKLKVLEFRSGGRESCKFTLPQSLLNLSNFRVLMLRNCECLESSILGEMGNLEILSLERSAIDCGVEVIERLKKLKILDLTGFSKEDMLASNSVKELSRLEELHGCYFQECEVEGINSSSSSLSGLNLPPNLTVLSTAIENVRSLPKDYCFPNLQSYDISVGREWCNMAGRKARTLELRGFEEVSMIKHTFKLLLPTVEYLYLEECKNLYGLRALYSPSGFLQKLGKLRILNCDKMESVFEENGTGSTLPLEILELEELPALKHVWKEPTQLVSLSMLTEVSISKCSKLTFIFSKSLASSLQQLEILRIRQCIDLEEVISTSGHLYAQVKFELSSCFPNLRELEVYGCDKLKRIFSVLTPRALPSLRHLPKLQKLFLRDNTKLKHVFEHQHEMEDGHVDWRHTLHCPLEVLSVMGCPEMYTHFVVAHLQAPSAKQVTTIEVDNLKVASLFSISTARSMMQLEVLKISKCSNLTEIISTVEDEREEIQSFDDKGSGAWFSQLKELEVRECENIINFASNSGGSGKWVRRDSCFLKDSIISLVRLTKMQVVGCRKLTSLFSVSVARSMVQLKVLQVSKCNELKQIIFTNQDEGKETESTGFEAHAACFPHLEELEVTDCEMMSSFLFPSFVAHGLAQLRKLRVSKLPKLKHLFGDHREEGDWHGRDYWLPLLTNLKVDELPNLISVWQSDCISSSWLSEDWDSLLLQCQPVQVLDVSGCPNFSTFFVANRQSQLLAQAAKQPWSIGLNNFQGGQFMMQFRREDENHQLWCFYLLGLCLRDVVGIECIWRGSPQEITMCFASLKCVTVTDCNIPKQVFTSKIVKVLAQLECLTIVRCSELEHVIEEGDEDGNLKSLRILKVIQCERMKTIFSHSVTYHHLPKLEELHLKGNPELRNISSHKIVDAKSEESMIDINVLQLPSSTLKVLVVSGCPQISQKNLQLNIQLQAPAELRIISLEKIEGIEEVIQLQRKDVNKSLTFDLQWLNLYHLQDLKCVWKGPAKNVHFSNLNAVVVKHCNELKQLFTTTIARSMLKLRFLTIEQCSKLQHVVIADQEDNVVNNNIIVLFPELEWLRLKDLPELINLCPSSAYQLKPNSKKHWLKMEGCPKAKDIEESFSRTEIEGPTEENEVIPVVY